MHFRKNNNTQHLCLSSLMTMGLMAALTFLSQPVYAGNNSAQLSPTSPITQSYNEGATVYPGMLVEQDNSHNGVVALKTQDITKMLGVVIPVGGAVISLTPATTQSNQVLVAYSGQYNVLVTNQNGAISSGDYLTISSLDGIAMKSTKNDKTVIGRAESGFSGANNVIGSEKIKDTNGKTYNYSIGSAEVNLQLGPNPIFAQNNAGLPTFIVQTAYNLANKPVNPARIYISLGILLVIMVILGSMLYGGVKSSIISIGRNPLSKKPVNRELLQTFLAGIFILIVGVALAYVVIIIA